METRTFTRKEIENRNSRNDALIVIDNVVYDVTGFLEDHPGGAEVLLENAGKDASLCFHRVGHSEVALEWRQRFRAGELVPEDWREVRPAEVLADPEEPLTLAGLLGACGPPLLLALVAALFYLYLM